MSPAAQIRRRSISAPLPSLPSFSPASLSGIQIWLDASTIGIVNGADVTSWLDQSGQSNDATGVSNVPTYATGVLNGLPVVRFSGSNQSLVLDSTIGGVTRSVFAVAKNTDFSTGSVVLGQAASSDHYIYLITSVIARSGAGTTQSGTFADGAFRVCEHWANGVNSRTAYDGNYGTLGGDTNSMQFTHVGAYSGAAYYMQGDIAEIIVYNRALTISELSQVRAYLATKYGLTVTP